MIVAAHEVRPGDVIEWDDGLRAQWFEVVAVGTCDGFESILLTFQGMGAECVRFDRLHGFRRKG